MEEPWLQSLIGIPTVGPDIAAHALRQTEGLPRSTKIQPFRAPKQCLLVESTLRKYPQLDVDINELVKIVGAVDPEFRPLMVWLYIDHLSQGEDLRHARGLLESYIGLQRQRHWQPANVSEIDEINTALVTFCQGISTQISETWTEDARTRAGAPNETPAREGEFGSIRSIDRFLNEFIW